MTNRRDFLKAAGLTLSGAILSACGTNSDPAPPAAGTDGVLPNGYRFYRLKGSDDALPGGLKGQTLRTDAAIDAQGRVIYGAVDSSDLIGLYAMQLDLGGAAPRIEREQRLVRTGDTLDGRRVVELNSYDINRHGHLAVVLKVETDTLVNTVDDHGQFDGGTAPMRLQVLYCDLGQGLVQVAAENTVNAEGHAFAGIFGDVSLHDDGNMIFTAEYYHHLGDGRKTVRQGVFHLKGSDGGQARLLAATGARLAASAAAPSVTGFGLVCLHDGGQFVIQTQLTPAQLGGLGTQSAEGAVETAVLRGHLGALTPASVRTGALSGFQTIASSISSGLRPQGTRADGLTLFGPRCGPNQSVAHVLSTADTHRLIVNNRVLLQSGDRSPSGHVVDGIVTPQLAADGVTFFVVSTASGVELLASNGRETRVLLQNGDALVNDARPVSEFIGMGYTAVQADDEGRLVFVVGHDDHSLSLVLGLPV